MYYVSGSDLERLFYFFQTKRLRFDEIGISRTRIICSIYWFKTISKTEISLSEEFFAGKPIAIDAKVKVLITGKNNDIITQYVLFTKVIDEQRNLYKNNTQTAITETIRICKDKNILKEYLENHEKEVIDIMVTLYSQEEVLRDYVTSEKFTSEVKGIVELSQELGRSFADTVSYVAKKCNVSKDIAERKVNSFWN